MADEVSKIRAHLDLLRAEYVKLQTKHAELEKKYQVVQASAGKEGDDTFVSRLLATIADLFNKDLYSDLTVQLQDQTIKAHRFVLAARCDNWGVSDLSQTSTLDLTDVKYDVGHALLRWVYTDVVDIQQKDIFLLDLLKAARKYKLWPLSDRCEQALMSSVTMRNCIRYYQTAEEIGANLLKQHCSELISNHWHDFTSEDFESMPASLAYQMFKSKSEYPLHTAIRTHREDVVFLYLVEHDSQLPGKLNEVDNKEDLALDLALQDKLESIANTLVKHRVDVNRADHTGLCLLHKAIKRGDDYAAKFLINNKCDVNAATPLDKETALHLVAGVTNDEVAKRMADIATQLLSSGANVNAQDTAGITPIQKAVMSQNEAVFSVLLESRGLDLEKQNSEGHTVLWHALQAKSPFGDYDESSYASRLIKKGSSSNAVNSETGDCLLHLASRAGLEDAGLFLANNNANGNLANQKGEIPLHTACQMGLEKLSLALLQRGANPNAQTSVPLGNLSGGSTICRQTPLHIAIQERHKNVVNVFLQYKAQVTTGGNNVQIIPNFTVKDSQDQTVLALAMWQGFHDIAIQLISGGANVNDYNSEGLTLLHQAILKQDGPSALFLLQNQADCNVKTKDSKTCLQLAISQRLADVADNLCMRGANMNVLDETGDCPLWQAMESGQEDVASILVKHGCDTNMWGPGPGGCLQNLLHRCIDENNETMACFLIRSMCDINSSRKLGPNGEGDEEARDGQSPLHMCATWGLVNVVQTLLEFNADVNLADAEGKTPLHIAIENQHDGIITLLLQHLGIDLMKRDKQGMTPFAAAMMTKNNKAAQAILNREPTAAEQYDSRGRNFLHIAIQKSDIESVLFLISVHCNVNSRVKDSGNMTPLLLAVEVGAEIIVRNLLLAGANVNDRTPKKKTSLHIAAEKDYASICSVLLDNGCDFDALDDGINNGLHIACQNGNISTVRSLLTESHINAEHINMRGQNPIHILGQYGRENAAAIFDLFMECMPEYPIDKPDINGDTILLLAYRKGNGNLCRAVVRAGASLGVQNKEGMTIFNYPVATKQLMFKLLDMLSKEPPWVDGECCLECGVRFGIKTRKHHCRHCGRLLCAKCSCKDMPIIKYNLTKPVRVCEVCFDGLTLGAGGF